ncbi:MAG TPA: saccharopine dehydrogenase NADP-binding domain-containing protein [Woeseiaceae bacterium]|nr:saccharopine dehydrogenase NADP-binding domain-containing protein [Woeseiaceae bacterium]
MPERQTVVVLGATGHFGGRMCRRLLDEPVTLVVTARDAARAAGFAAELKALCGTAIVEAAAIDMAAPDLGLRLRALSPLLVLSAAGPYQGQDYRVARACIDAGCHYLDLADGRDFVAGFAALNEAALARDVLLVTGASTLPGVSSAIVAASREWLRSIAAVRTCIAPAHRTPRGIGTIEAVLSYCGRPFRVLEDGTWRTRHGWQDLRVERLAGLGVRLSAACDVPDLGLFPERIDGLRTATFHAALEAPWEQLALWLMAGASRAGLVHDWRPWACRFQRIARNLERFGSEDGGMTVAIDGHDASGRALRVRFRLTARRNHGPEIPVVPLLILARRLLRGDLGVRGALPCYGLVTLEEIAAEMRDFAVDWSFEVDA